MAIFRKLLFCETKRVSNGILTHKWRIDPLTSKTNSNRMCGGVGKPFGAPCCHSLPEIIIFLWMIVREEGKETANHAYKSSTEEDIVGAMSIFQRRSVTSMACIPFLKFILWNFFCQNNIKIRLILRHDPDMGVFSSWSVVNGKSVQFVIRYLRFKCSWYSCTSVRMKYFNLSRFDENQNLPY